ncbi:alcohol dehydrogenase [Phytophthora cinnamomi]|uniref:alcohol dehydrogenase n=1 Tax=Phytophthora cinnamomi TaxID=4785 RepID=UPI003559949B|nr:alcohol dehydrogenase [Phytophthora cinnamomi]
MSFTSTVWALASLEEAGKMESGETVFATAAAGGTDHYSVENVEEVLNKAFPGGINLLFDSSGSDLMVSLVPHLANPDYGYKKKDETTLNSVLLVLISKVLVTFKKGKLRYGTDDVKFVKLNFTLDALEYVMSLKNSDKVAVKIQDLPCKHSGYIIMIGGFGCIPFVLPVTQQVALITTYREGCILARHLAFTQQQ